VKKQITLPWREKEHLPKYSENTSNIDMEDYEKLLRTSIHSLLIARKKRKAKLGKESDSSSLLVSQQEIDEEILKNPRDKIEDYRRLKFRYLHRKIYDRKLKLKSKEGKAFDPIHVTDEEIQRELDKENELRVVKIVLDFNSIKGSKASNLPALTQNGSNITSKHQIRGGKLFSYSKSKIAKPKNNNC